MKLVWIHDSNSNSIYGYLNALYLFCPKQRTSIVQTCMKMVQMDSLNFFDNFSYINYLIWSYGWISMIFRSFSYFLKLINHFRIYLNSRTNTASAWRNSDVSRVKGVDQVKPDQWGPLVSDWGWIVPMTGGAGSTDTSARSKLTCGTRSTVTWPGQTDRWGHGH